MQYGEMQEMTENLCQQRSKPSGSTWFEFSTFLSFTLDKSRHILSYD